MLMFYLSAVLLFGMVTGIQYEDCGSTSSLLNVTVSNCDQEEVCILKRGENATIDIYFTPGKRVESVRVNGSFTVFGRAISFTDSSTINGCNESGLSCPLLPGQPQHYTSTVLVKKNYPRWRADINWILTDEHQDTIVCTKFDAKLE